MTSRMFSQNPNERATALHDYAQLSTAAREKFVRQFTRSFDSLDDPEAKIQMIANMGPLANDFLPFLTGVLDAKAAGTIWGDDVPNAVLRALGQMRSKEAVPSLLAMIRVGTNVRDGDPCDNMCLGAIQVLGEIGANAKEAVPTLTRLIEFLQNSREWCIDMQAGSSVEQRFIGSDQHYTDSMRKVFPALKAIDPHAAEGVHRELERELQTMRQAKKRAQETQALKDEADPCGWFRIVPGIGRCITPNLKTGGCTCPDTCHDSGEAIRVADSDGTLSVRCAR